MATEDLNEIFNYTALDGPINTLKIYANIKNAAEKLCQFPEHGRIVPELQAYDIFSHRELIINPWRIIFRVQENTIFISRVIDGRCHLE